MQIRPANVDDAEGIAFVNAVAACYAHPDFWRAGVGRMLMNWLLADIDYSTWNKLVVWTARDTPGPIAFYESFGLTLDGGQDVLQRGTGMDIVRLSKSI